MVDEEGVLAGLRVLVIADSAAGRLAGVLLADRAERRLLLPRP